MRATIVRHAHRLQYSSTDTSALRRLLPADDAVDAFDLVLQLAYERSQQRQLVKKGTATQRSIGEALSRAIVAFYNETSIEHAGVCRDMSGAWDAGSCDDSPSARKAAWGPPRPLFSRATSIGACRRRCQRCARCRVFSFSQLQQGCLWHHSCHRPDLTNLERRYEFWTFRTERVRAESNVTSRSVGTSRDHA